MRMPRRYVGPALPAVAAAIALLFALLAAGPLTLPTISILALAGAGLIAAVAWSWRAAQQPGRVTMWDAAGALAFVGFAAGMLSEPEQVLEFVSLTPSAE
jgi:prepilin signal peptidase PulO-like enzyme (type II secretory pathway)